MRPTLRATTFALLISGLGGVASAQAPIKIAFVNSQTLMEAAPGRAAATDLLTKEVMAPITDQVKKVIDDIRVEDGYAIILDNAPGAGNIVSADKNLDITDRVVSRLRATPAAKIAAPAATKPGAPASPAGVTGRPPVKPPTQ